jgi:hypothetical protein
MYNHHVLLNFITCNAKEVDQKTSTCLQPLGDIILKDGKFAFVMKRYWSDF